MRRVADAAGGEKGAVAVLVAVLMVVMLGFAAISVDVAKLFSERAQLQNGADAVALMVAQKCAKNQLDPNCSQEAPEAKALAGKNAVDDLSNVKSIILDKSGRAVSVTATAEELGTSVNSVSMFFAGVLGFSSAEVSAKSSVVWGTPVAGRTAFPLAFSICQVKDQVDGPMQLLQSHSRTAGNGGNSGCNYNASGQTVPGGFGYLPTNGGSCSAAVNLAHEEGWVQSDPGVDEPAKCTQELNRWASEMSAGRDIIIYLPVFDMVSGTGNTAKFHLVSFAALKVAGWKLSGPDDLPYTFRNKASTDTGVTTSTQCLGSCRGIIGRFVRYVSLENFTMGPGDQDPNGAFIVRLTP